MQGFIKYIFPTQGSPILPVGLLFLSGDQTV